MKLCFIWVGKTKSSPIRSLLDEYIDRLSKFAPVSVIVAREEGSSATDQARALQVEGEQLLAKTKESGVVVVLDEGGVQMSSRELADYLERQMRSSVKQVTFVVGGHTGIHESVKERANLKLSLGRMTLTHEMARVLLTEQVYRAFTMIRNVPYHR
jgi:23S rRNA (pseudouridine1915-N3)-methyltransferase